ncbi:MAG TPA: LmeA family phospholipid-binding protein [Solirubrobacteraceae bacterium]|jgi:hypothetical protein|nr:LmeA family phospholipid-binding protein [Solirubrobacteraceae bacterium]
MDRLGRGPLIAAVVLATVCVLLALSQLLLPGIAASRLRTRLSRNGVVERVSVSAFPALKLLWGHADKVTVHYASMHVNNARVSSLMGQSRNVGKVDVYARTLDIGPLSLTNAVLHKRGDQLTGEAALSTAALSHALPSGFSVQPVASGNGELELRASASLFGLGVSADVLLEAQEGSLVLVPIGIPIIGSSLRLTVFNEPNARVSGVGARTQAGGYLLTAQGRLG